MKYKIGDHIHATGMPDFKWDLTGVIFEVNYDGYYRVHEDNTGLVGMVFEKEVVGLMEDLVGSDDVNHPSHYTSYKGIEVIQLTEQMNFNRGNVIKYTSRAGLKNPGTEIQDLEKAKWYLEREITRIKNL